MRRFLPSHSGAQQEASCGDSRTSRYSSSLQKTESGGYVVAECEWMSDIWVLHVCDLGEAEGLEAV